VFRLHTLELNIITMNDKLDYWIMFVEGDITLETLTELLNDYV